MAYDQGRTLDLEREKRLDATRTLKNSKADLLKARENLKKATKAKDSTETGLAGIQKQAKCPKSSFRLLRSRLLI